MIFDLPPIVGFLPLLLYIILMLKNTEMNVAVIISVILGAVLTGESIIGFGEKVATALGSFTVLIGFIIVLGSGLGEVMTRTKVAHNIVYKVVNRANINSKSKGVVVSMLISTLLVALLGTLSGANAIIAPILIPIVASIGISPDTLGVLLHGAGAAGYSLGPFCPVPVTIMGLTGISYTQYLTNVGIPIFIILWACTLFNAWRMEKNKDKLNLSKYTEEDELENDFIPNNKINNATIAFLVTMFGLLIYGIFTGAGASHAIFVMLLASIITGIVGGLRLKGSISAMLDGASRMFYMFFMFVMFELLLNYVAGSGAFEAVTRYMQPLINVGGEFAFLMLSAAIGVFGISGAGVAQIQIIDELFKPLVISLNIAMPMWAIILSIGSQITFFVSPTVDMVAQMGLARSKNIKEMLKNGWLISITVFIALAIRSFIYMI